VGEERRERAGRSESAREERGSWEEEGRMAARAWMRERALDTDSHHECIGSVAGFLGSAALGVGMDEDGDDESLR